MYMQDYDGGMQEMLIGGFQGAAGTRGEPSTWMGVILPYTKNGQIFRCTSSVISTVEPIDYGSRKRVSIGMNSFLGWYFNYWYDTVWVPQLSKDDPNLTKMRPVTEPLITYPAQTVGFADGFDRVDAFGNTPRGYWIDPGFPDGARFGLSDRHSRGTNLALMDGHAKWYRTNAIQSQAAIDTPAPNPSDGKYIEMTNYNAAGLIWDVDAANQYTAPNKWPTDCCTIP